MPHERLSSNELTALIHRVFQPRDSDRSLAILVDLPDKMVPDNADWATRRKLAAEWAETLTSAENELGLSVKLWLYRNAHGNNADLPPTAASHDGTDLPQTWEEIENGPSEPFEDVLKAGALAIAPTEFSATAPLKVASRERGFRAATMPGFSVEMIPALRLDYTEVNRRVMLLKDLLDRAESAAFEFVLTSGDHHELFLDLRFRKAHASGGILTESGTAGNLPSGETYIVPYEGEVEGEKSLSSGTIPVQFDDEVVVYRVEENRAVAVISEGAKSESEAARLEKEPAYGNLSELGLGVLGDFGLDPIGEVLLDEKLGLHIAFGRSEHFGGQVGPEDFSSPDAVIHIDRVYIKAIQPDVQVARVDLKMEDGSTVALMRDGEYAVSF